MQHRKWIYLLYEITLRHQLHISIVRKHIFYYFLINYCILRPLGNTSAQQSLLTCVEKPVLLLGLLQLSLQQPQLPLQLCFLSF